MKIMKAVYIFCLMLWVFCSCQEQPSRPVKEPTESELKKSLEKTNRYLINEEEEEIDNYVRRHQLEMISTGTGLRYQIVEGGQGALIQQGQTVMMAYVLYDLTGDVVYSSDTEGLMKFVVGRSEGPSGLDEALRHLHNGDRAWVIVPSHLGYGILGDQKEIPSRATLIYSLKITKVE